jgi:predicted DNA-binding transcriptional regulator YafY
MDFPEDMTPVQRAARLLELLEGNRVLPVRDVAARLGVQRRTVYRIVNNIGHVCPDVRVEDGKVFREDL